MALSRRIFLITLAIALAALTGLTLVTSSWMRDTLREASLHRVADAVNRETRVLQRSFEMLKSDALFLAELDTVRIATARPDDVDAGAEARASLAKTLAAMMSRRPSYTQLRLISAFDNGRELVRVNRSDDGVEVVPASALQHKGDRYYVDASLKTPPGRLYVSRVDLNQEHDRIVEPHEPVFRVGTPVMAADGSVVGAIVVNIRYDAFIGEMTPPNADLTLTITNEDGDYLSHPDAARRFGFEFGRPVRIQDDLGIAAQWKAMRDVVPVSTILGERGLGVVFDRIVLGQGETDHGRYLIVAAMSPVTDLDVQATAFGWRTLVFAVALAIALAIALAFATSRLTRPVVLLTAAAERIGAGERNVALPIDHGGEIGVLTRTISRMLAALQEASRSEEMASMGRLASQVAHDLRNALSPVKMNIQILARRHVGADDPDARHLAIAGEQVQYIESILSDMLAFARGEALRTEPVDLVQVLSGAVLSEIESLESKNILVTTRGAEEVGQVFGDRIKLTQVFQNLIENAVQASPQGGRVDIVTREETASTVAIDVVDRGEGILAENRARIFEPYFTTRTRGTGLGLAIVSRIVKQHGGMVTVLDTPGGGTTVRVELPLRRMG